jgi:hypothetical protein
MRAIERPATWQDRAAAVRAEVMTATRSVGRIGVRSYGVLTSRARSLPDFLIIGAKRSGTTSMYQYLLEHPQVLPLFPSAEHLPMRANIKGIHYFDANFDRGLGWYRSHFPLEATRQRAAQRLGRPVRSGEASPYYLFHPHAAERAHAVVPSARVIVLLRDPTDRAYSHYLEQRRRGHEALASFDEALDAEPARLAGAAQRMAEDPRHRSFAHEHQSYVAQGKYLEPLRRWLDRFPASQLLVLRSEDFFADPQRSYDGVLELLGLAPFDLPNPEPFNAIPKHPMTHEQRARLDAEFALHNAALEALLGRRLWPARV